MAEPNVNDEPILGEVLTIDGQPETCKGHTCKTCPDKVKCHEEIIKEFGE